MAYTYSIEPSIGVVRVGNSLNDFFLAPDQIGGLPIECDEYGDEESKPFSTFKDAMGRVRRQAQKFRVYRYNSDNPKEPGEELTLDTAGVEKITWTVHLANKKAAWYKFSEYQGNLLFGKSNSYAAQKVPLRNQDAADRQKLIIDPGFRTISGKKQSFEISRKNIPADYIHGNFPYPSDMENYQGTPFEKLGDIKTDSAGHLLVLGGAGKSWGTTDLQGYGGGDGWYDDISDGSVTCTIELENGESYTLDAWVVVGPSDFAPEITNISTWDDTMLDVGVRCFNLVPEMYSNGAWHDNFKANYQRDILPIIQRISRYHWVANVQSAIAFSSNIFDFSDHSEANKQNRQKYFSYFRKPEPPNPANFGSSRQYTLFNDDKVPMMPLNSGSNSVKNINIEKFLALTQTQYFLLKQWADGNFTNDIESKAYPINHTSRASVGNVVGLPQCPGIEVTWSVQNPKIYAEPYKIKHREAYDCPSNSLSPNRDECEGCGCEPGDLTKRMAIPWQADFYNCSIQYINFTDRDANKDQNGEGNLVPKPPTYYTYWWPPQAPWDVLSGDLTTEAQALSHIPAGLQVNHLRGLNGYKDMVEGWSYLGFIRNQNTGEDGQMFPYILETERDHEMFDYQSVPIGQIIEDLKDNKNLDYEIPVWYLKSFQERKEVNSLKKLILQRFKPTSSLKGQKLDKAIPNNRMAQAEEHMYREIKVAEEHLKMPPRSGTRTRF